MSESTPASAGLSRQLGLRHLVANGLVFIGPAAPVGIFGTLLARSHGAVVSVYLVATVVMTLTALAYAQLSAVVPRAGSVYSYATAAIGPRTGFMAGWMVLLDYVLIPSVAFLFTGLAMHSFVSEVPAWLWSGAAVVVATLLNLTGARALARAAIVVVAAETVVLAAVLVGAVGVLLRDGATQSWHAPLTGVGSFSVTAVVGAVSVAALAFLGFDAIATFAEESAGVPRLVGRAMVACLLVAGLLFFVQTYLMALITPISPAHLAADPSLQGTTFYDVTRSQIAPWLATTLGVSKALGSTFAGMVGVAAGSRIVMTMAREGRLPAVLGRVSARGHVPYLATAGITTVTLALAVWAAHEPTGLDLLASTVSLGALTAFVGLHACVVSYFVLRRHSRRWLLHLVVPVLGAAALIAIIVEADHRAQIVAAVWLVVGLLLALARRRAVVPDPAPEGVHHG